MGALQASAQAGSGLADNQVTKGAFPERVAKEIEPGQQRIELESFWNFKFEGPAQRTRERRVSQLFRETEGPRRGEGCR